MSFLSAHARNLQVNLVCHPADFDDKAKVILKLKSQVSLTTFTS